MNYLKSLCPLSLLNFIILEITKFAINLAHSKFELYNVSWYDNISDRIYGQWQINAG